MARVHSAARSFGPVPPTHVLCEVFRVGPTPVPFDIDEASPALPLSRAGPPTFRALVLFLIPHLTRTFSSAWSNRCGPYTALPFAFRNEFSFPVFVRKLQAALWGCDPSTAPGLDGLFYLLFLVDHSLWHQALALCLSLVLHWACVPSLWIHGVVVPLFKNSDRRLFGNYHSITLLSCALNFLEYVLHARVFLTPLWTKHRLAFGAMLIRTCTSYKKFSVYVIDVQLSVPSWICKRYMMLSRAQIFCSTFTRLASVAGSGCSSRSTLWHRCSCPHQ